MIQTTILILLIIAIALFILSFFRKDKTAMLEKQVEELSITHMQEMYQLKKRLRILEDELLISHEQSPFQYKASSSQKLTDEVLQFANQGDQPQQIADKTGLTRNEVMAILAKAKGGEY